MLPGSFNWKEELPVGTPPIPPTPHLSGGKEEIPVGTPPTPPTPHLSVVTCCNKLEWARTLIFTCSANSK